jgi:creatinine amidohydrolase
VMFLNGHGGNEVPAAQALNELIAEDEHAASCHLAMASWWQIGRDAIDPRKHGMATPFISHADEYETSLILAIRPDLVRTDSIRESQPVLQSRFYNFEYGGKVGVFRRYHRLTDTGSMGRPALGTKEKGASLLAAVSADVVAFLRDFATWPELPIVKTADRG